MTNVAGIEMTLPTVAIVDQSIEATPADDVPNKRGYTDEPC